MNLAAVVGQLDVLAIVVAQGVSSHDIVEALESVVTTASLDADPVVLVISSEASQLLALVRDTDADEVVFDEESIVALWQLFQALLQRGLGKAAAGGGGAAPVPVVGFFGRGGGRGRRGGGRRHCCFV